MNALITHPRISGTIRLFLLAALLIGATGLHPASAQPTVPEQSFSIEENSSNGTQIGQITAEGGSTRSIRLAVGTQSVGSFSAPQGTTMTRVNFPSQFWYGTPAVISQIQGPGTSWIKRKYTYSGTQYETFQSSQIFYRTRQNNASYKGFDVTLEVPYPDFSTVQTIEYGGAEPVGWLAVDLISGGTLSGIPFESFLTGEVVKSHRKSWSQVSFNAPYTQTPNILAGIATLKSTIPAGVMYSVDKSKISLSLDDTQPRSTNQAGEAVSVVAAGQDGLLKNTNGVVIGEVGTISGMTTNGERTIQLQHAFTNPVVFVQPLSSNGTHDYIFRFTNISATSFSGRLQTSGYDQYTWRGQGLHYFVFESGTWDLPYQRYSYSITGGNDSGAFAIDSKTGILSVADSAQLDYESGVTSYTLEITVKDFNGYSGSGEVIVDVKDVLGDSLETDATIKIMGQSAGDQLGRDLANAGDVNGDGLDDLIIGAPFADPNGRESGRAYVVFSTGGAAEIDLSAVASGSGGFVINGETAGDRAGYGVAGAGDINGDGLADLLVGAPYADVNGTNSGKAYVVFGKADIGAVELSAIAADGNNGGFALIGAHAYDFSGGSVAIADINGDGLDDLLIGEQYVTSYENPASPGFSYSSGSGQPVADDAALVYVAFGKTDGKTVLLSEIAGNNNAAGFVVTNSSRQMVMADDGESWYYRDGAVVTARDVNADGLADIIIGGGGFFLEKVYVAFGKSDGAAVALNSGDGKSFKITIDGLTASYYPYWFGGIGSSPAAIGDVNGDGVDDIAIPVPDPDRHTGLSYPTVYIAYGGSGLGADLNLSSLGSGQGFSITQDSSPVSDYIFLAQDVGDVNGDGLDDILIGSPENQGALYLVYGSADNGDVLISTLEDDGRGFRFLAQQTKAFLGWDIHGAGDWNGDGIADYVAGSAGFDGPAGTDSGKVYGLFGKGDWVTQWGSITTDTLNGNAAADFFAAGRGDDTLNGNGGADALYGGPGNDTIVIGDANVLRVDGGHGTDTLQLDGAGLLLDLRAAPARVRNVEIFDISGSGNNRIALASTAGGLDPTVGHGRTIVKGDSDDRVLALNQQWTPDGTVGLDSIVFNRLTNPVGAELLVQQGVGIDLNVAPALPDQTFITPEGVLKGALLGTVVGTDDDLGDVLSYSVLSGNEDGDLELDADSGELRVVAARLDFEKTPVYNLLAQVEDRFGETAVGVITVVVEDLDTGVDTQGNLPVDLSNESIWGSNLLTALLGPDGKFSHSFNEDFSDYSPVDETVVDISMSGTVSGQYQFDIKGGVVNMSAPVSYSISYPDEIEPGQPVTLDTSAALASGASFTASSPAFDASASLALNDFDFNLKTKFLEAVGVSLGLNELEIDPGAFSLDISESLSANGASAGSTPSSSNPLRLEANLTLPWFQKSKVYDWKGAPVPMKGEKNFCWEQPAFFPYGDLAYGVNYTILDSVFWFGAELAQNFAVDFTPTATLTLEDGSTYTFKLAEGLTFTPEAAQDVDGDGNISATLTMDPLPQFSNETDLRYTVANPFKAVEVNMFALRGACQTDAASNHGPATWIDKTQLVQEIFLNKQIGPVIDIDPRLNFDDSLDPVSFPLKSQTQTLALSFDLNQCTGGDCDNIAPVASDVAISGAFDWGATLTGGYNYSDADSDPESGSAYQWYRALNSSGAGSQAIDGATGTNYALTADDAGKYVRFCVTPSDGTAVGATACSDWLSDEEAPETVLTSTPDNPSSLSWASFEFSGSDNFGAAGYECRVDGSEFSLCASPRMYAYLPNGQHSFEVRTFDAAGNIDSTPAAFTWVINADDITPPPTPTTPAVVPEPSTVFLLGIGLLGLLGLARRKRK